MQIYVQVFSQGDQIDAVRKNSQQSSENLDVKSENGNQWSRPQIPKGCPSLVEVFLQMLFLLMWNCTAVITWLVQVMANECLNHDPKSRPMFENIGLFERWLVAAAKSISFIKDIKTLVLFCNINFFDPYTHKKILLQRRNGSTSVKCCI